MILTNKFDLEVFTHSNKAIECGIDNKELTDEQFENLEQLHKLLLEIQSRLSIKYSKPINIKINSGYRCPLLNKKIGGVATSLHCSGKAVDSVALGISVKEYFDSVKELVKENIITIGECINEISWLHLSIPDEKNKNEFLKMRIINGKKQYVKNWKETISNKK